MARSTKAKSSKPKPAKRTRGLLAAANVSGIGDFETFTLIREMHDRLAERGGDAQAAKRPSLAAAMAVLDATSDSPWIAVARGELGQEIIQVRATILGRGISQYHRSPGKR